MGAFIVLGLTALAVGWFWWSRGRFYGRLYHAAHYAELASAGLKLREALLREVEKNPTAAGYGPGQYLSHAGVTVLVSLHRVPDGFAYHLSLSCGGETMAFAAGGRFLYLVAGGLGIQDHAVAVACTPIIHGIYRLTAEEHTAARPAFEEPSSAEDVERLKDEAGRYLGRLHGVGPLHGTEEALLKASGLE